MGAFAPGLAGRAVVNAQNMPISSKMVKNHIESMPGNKAACVTLCAFPLSRKVPWVISREPSTRHSLLLCIIKTQFAVVNDKIIGTARGLREERIFFTFLFVKG